jgi:cation diffusion facilitator family transporter
MLNRPRLWLISISVVVTAITLAITGYAAYISNSATLLADFLKCLVEFVAIFLAFLIILRTETLDASRYNYGFGKIEQLSSSVVAIAMFCSGLLCIAVAVERFLDPKPIEGAYFGFVFAVLSVLGNGFMWYRFKVLHNEKPSPINYSQARLFYSKMAASGVVVVSLFSSLSAQNFPILLYGDAVGSLFLALFLMFSAYSLASSAISDLIDRSIDEGLQLSVMKVLVKYEDSYKGFQQIKSRQVGTKRFIHIFLNFGDAQLFSEIKQTINAIKTETEAVVPNCEVLVIPV